jgi:hypothetical protein
MTNLHKRTLRQAPDDSERDELLSRHPAMLFSCRFNCMLCFCAASHRLLLATAWLLAREYLQSRSIMCTLSNPATHTAPLQALEKYLMTKLHERTFRQAPDDVERDELLAVRCSGLGFVQPAHLEVPDGIVDEAALARAAAELNKMNNFKVGRSLQC